MKTYNFEILICVLLISACSGFEYQYQGVSFGCDALLNMTDSVALCQSNLAEQNSYSILDFQNISNITYNAIGTDMFCDMYSPYSVNSVNLFICLDNAVPSSLNAINLTNISQMYSIPVDGEQVLFNNDLWLVYEYTGSSEIGSVVDTVAFSIICNFIIPVSSDSFFIQAFLMTSPTTVQFVVPGAGVLNIIDYYCNNNTYTNTSIPLSYDGKTLSVSRSYIFEYEGALVYLVKPLKEFEIFTHFIFNGNQLYETQVQGDIVQINSTNFATVNQSAVLNYIFNSSTSVQIAAMFAFPEQELGIMISLPIYTPKCQKMMVQVDFMNVILDINTMYVLNVMGQDTLISLANGSSLQVTDAGQNINLLMYDQSSIYPKYLSGVSSIYSVYPFSDMWFLGATEMEQNNFHLYHFTYSPSTSYENSSLPLGKTYSILAASNVSGSLCYAILDEDSNSLHTYFNGVASKADSTGKLAFCTSTGVMQLSGDYYKFTEDLYANMTDNDTVLSIYSFSSGAMTQQFNFSELVQFSDFVDDFIPVQIDANNTIVGLFSPGQSQSMFINQYNLSYNLTSPINRSNYLYSIGNSLYFQDTLNYQIAYQVDVLDWTITRPPAPSDPSSSNMGLVIAIASVIVVGGILAGSIMYYKKKFKPIEKNGVEMT